MAYRKQIIVAQQIYHVFNRSVAREPIFTTARDYQRFLETIDFYHYTPSIRFSYFNRLGLEERKNCLDGLRIKGEKQVSIFALDLMPNHFHFVLKGEKEKGVNDFICNIQNSYAKFFNIKMGRNGSLFQEMFKANLIETDEELLHVVRYVHLNPYSSQLVKNIEQLEKYPWSSFPSYLGKGNLDFIDTDFLKGFYSNIDDFRKFTLDQMDYQKNLDIIKHLGLDD